jgi:hypothetical protein
MFSVLLIIKQFLHDEGILLIVLGCLLGCLLGLPR